MALQGPCPALLRHSTHSGCRGAEDQGRPHRHRSLLAPQRAGCRVLGSLPLLLRLELTLPGSTMTTTSDFTFAWEHEGTPDAPCAHLQVVRFHGLEELSTLH